MTENELIGKLGQLKRIKPNQDWVIFCRGNLSAKIGKVEDMKAAAAPSLKLFEFLSLISQKVWRSSFLKPAVSLALIFLFIFTSGLVVLAKAKESLPGDRLFPVKIAFEQARLLATPSAEGKVKLQNKMMASRVQELNEVIAGSESMETKQPKIEEAVSNLQKHLLTVKDELPRIDKSEAKKVVEAAKRIDESASQVQQALDQAKVALAPLVPAATNELSEKIAEASNEADKASTKALEVLVEKQKEPGAAISQSEIVAKLDEKIQKTEQKIKLVEETIGKSAIGNKFPINAAIILDQSDKAKEVLDQAKASLKQNDMSAALKTVTAANEMVKGAEKLIDTVNNAPATQPGSLEPGTNQNATGTPSTLKPVATSTSSMLELTPSTTEMVQIIITSTVQAANVSHE